MYTYRAVDRCTYLFLILRRVATGGICKLSQCVVFFSHFLLGVENQAGVVKLFVVCKVEINSKLYHRNTFPLCCV